MKNYKENLRIFAIKNNAKKKTEVIGTAWNQDGINFLEQYQDSLVQESDQDLFWEKSIASFQEAIKLGNKDAYLNLATAFLFEPNVQNIFAAANALATVLTNRKETSGNVRNFKKITLCEGGFENNKANVALIFETMTEGLGLEDLELASSDLDNAFNWCQDTIKCYENGHAIEEILSYFCELLSDAIQDEKDLELIVQEEEKEQAFIREKENTPPCVSQWMTFSLHNTEKTSKKAIILESIIPEKEQKFTH